MAINTSRFQIGLLSLQVGTLVSFSGGQFSVFYRRHLEHDCWHVTTGNHCLRSQDKAS